jgi:cytochrome c oxidase subunit 2
VNELFRRLLFLPEQASSLAREIDWLHFTVISTSCAGLVLVVGLIAYFAWRGPSGPRHGEKRVSMALEAFLIAGLLGMFLFFWLLGSRQYLKLATPPRDVLDVHVIGKQWMWSFSYADGTATNDDLYVPVGRPVRLTLSSRDVIHSFFVPAFRIKQDAVPGRSTVSWFEAVRPGVYQVFCAEYCGLSHSHMRSRVIALSPADYERWRRERRPVPLPADEGEALTSGRVSRTADLASIGEKVAARRGCLRCHTLDGTPHLGPSFAGLYRSSVPLEGGGLVLADESYLTRSMMDPAEQVHRGFAPIMPSYQGFLGAGEAAALVELIRSLESARPHGTPLPMPSQAAVVLPRQEPGLPADALPDAGTGAPRMPATPATNEGAR